MRPSDIGVRGALVGATVPHGLLVGAMGVSRTTSDSARIMGALTGAGLFVTFGIGRAYLGVILLYALGALLILATGPEFRHAADDATVGGGKRPTPWRDLKEGLAYIWNTPRLLAAMWIAFLVNLLAFPLVTGLMPFVARAVYHVDQTGLGTLIAFTAGGALTGSIALSIAGDRVRVDYSMVVTTLSWLALLLVFAHLHTMVAGIVCLFLIGFSQSTGMISLAVVLLRTAEPQFRGRVMGARMLAIYGNPLGLLVAGPLIERIGFTATATLYGAIGLASTFAVLMRWRTAIWRVPGAPA